jgi:hypothetical protein
MNLHCPVMPRTMRPGGALRFGAGTPAAEALRQEMADLLTGNGVQLYTSKGGHAGVEEWLAAQKPGSPLRASVKVNEFMTNRVQIHAENQEAFDRILKLIKPLPGLQPGSMQTKEGATFTYKGAELHLLLLKYSKYTLI